MEGGKGLAEGKAEARGQWARGAMSIWRAVKGGEKESLKLTASERNEEGGKETACVLDERRRR